MAKLMTQRASFELMDECLQIHGGMGYMGEHWAQRAARDARLGPIGGGSTRSCARSWDACWACRRAERRPSHRPSVLDTWPKAQISGAGCRCSSVTSRPLLLIALIWTLSLACALPGAAGAARTHSHRHRGAVHVRHLRIHRAPRKSKHGHKHKRKHHGKQAVRHARRMLPATAADECPNANLTPSANNIASVVAATLCLVNDERVRFGESALIEDPRLAAPRPATRATWTNTTTSRTSVPAARRC